MCHRIGRPPISTNALGMDSVRSRSRVPRPPQRMATVSTESGTAGIIAAPRRPRSAGPPGAAQPVAQVLAEEPRDEARVVAGVAPPQSPWLVRQAIRPLQ